MRFLRHIAVAVVTLFAFGVVTLGVSGCAHTGVGVAFGAEPDCPWGYYDYSPYSCAPYGYYGPEWFSGGVFVGAGPWFHGSRGFYGHVDTHFDTRSGYTGAMPEHGHYTAPADNFQNFHGTEMHDGRGHVRH
jgi:hypothetical protein